MDYIFNFPIVLRHWDKLAWGLLLSLELAALSILIGAAIGLALAVVHNDGPRWARTAVAGYVEFIRNVPLLLLIYLMFYGVPSIGGFAYDAATSFVITLSAYAAAQLVEVFRAGLDAVPKGVVDAGRAIGLTRWQRLLYVRLPVMFRVALPSLSNAFISLFKDTSLVFIMGLYDLLNISRLIVTGQEWLGHDVESYIFAGLGFWIFCFAMSRYSQRLERKLQTGHKH